MLCPTYGGPHDGSFFYEEGMLWKTCLCFSQFWEILSSGNYVPKVFLDPCLGFNVCYTNFLRDVTYQDLFVYLKHINYDGIWENIIKGHSWKSPASSRPDISVWCQAYRKYSGYIMSSYKVRPRTENKKQKNKQTKKQP